MSVTNVFIPGEEYVFIGKQNNFYPSNIEKNNFGHFKLGKFLCYVDFPLNGDIIPDAKAKFEFGIVDFGQYDNVIDAVLEHKKYA